MTRDQGGGREWDSFYERSMHLPSPAQTFEFLKLLPANAQMLDFGTGTGAWAAAFLRDRHDLSIDALDQNIHQAKALPQDFTGKRTALSFQDYRADKVYDAIWARAVLFFLPHPELEACFHQLALSLAHGGTIAFTMVDDCKAAALAKFHSMSESSLREMLDREGLELVKLTREAPPYGSKRIPIPTFDIYARKK